MNLRLPDLLKSFSLTLLILGVCEILTATIMPAMGWIEYRINFGILIILYLSFYFNNSQLPWLIFIIQIVHSGFSIDGGYHGTLAGLIMMGIISVLKDLVQLSSGIMIIITVQIFQMVWILISTLLICLKLSSFHKFGVMITQYIPGSLLISLLSPWFFTILSKIWKDYSESDSGVRL